MQRTTPRIRKSGRVKFANFKVQECNNGFVLNCSLACEVEKTISRRAIEELQLSDSTVLRRKEAIADDIQSQLKRDVETCEWFSLQFDESTDVSDTSQLAVIIRMLLTTLLRERGERTFTIFLRHMQHMREKFCRLPLKKLSAITTDGSPAMKRCAQGYSHLDTSWIINFIRAAPLQHRIFKELLEDSKDKRVNLILHAEVRWLSRGKVLSRFLSLIEPINELMQSNPENSVNTLKN
ncbi:hypothetical protein J437_LFUL016082 [Ladona fulva]|uniref:Uncharacterized protein n=1 Tax=Ladona fulva TaxID=123851 RepID=A0A8K0KKX6_LADFU|nr:hypothetical protein J437_LFUL016082 [Ladona fulva]